MFSAETKSVDISVNKLSESVVAWKHIAENIEPFLQAVASRLELQVNEFDPEIAPYAEYCLTGLGKQLRPSLVAMAAQSIREVNDSHITVAVIIEMVHLATLVHDDIMDEAAIRRGKQTLGAHWGNEIAVLFGDCLFAQALKLAASFPTPEICRSVAMATNVVCTGEILQTRQRRHFDLTEAEYFKVLEMKTAELFALSCEMGCLQAGGTSEQRSALRDYGIALGVAYQIYDDCLDLFGSEAVVGKSLGTDLAKGKLTLPILRFFKKATPVEKLEMQRKIENWDNQYLPSVLESLGKYEALTESIEIIHKYLKQAQQSLGKLHLGSATNKLTSLTHYLAHQTDKLGNCVKS